MKQNIFYKIKDHSHYEMALLIAFSLLMLIKALFLGYQTWILGSEFSEYVRQFCSSMVSDFLLLLLIVVLAFLSSFTKRTLVKILSIIIMFVVIVVYVIDIRVYLLFQSRVPLMEMGKFFRSLSGFFSVVVTNILVFVGCFLGIFFLVSMPTFKKLQRKFLLLFFSALLSLVGIGMLFYGMPVLPQNILQINLKSLQSFNTYLPVFSQDNPSSQEKVYTSYEDYFTTEKGSNKRPNIIIVFAESFSPIDSLAVGGVYDHLPHFDTIAQDGIVFTNFVNNGCTSDTAHIALLRGIEPMGTASYTGFQTYLESLPEFLDAYGYNTTFLSSVSLDFLNQRSFLEHMKFDIVGEEAFSSDKKYVFDAAPDFDLYHKALDLISKKSDPYLLVMQTISAHKPYTTPYGNTSADALRYADEMLGGFYHVLNLLHFFDNGILIIVGDHRKMDPQEPGEKEALGNLRYARGLATIVGTGIHPGTINTTITQHTDIFNGIRKLVATGNVLISELANDPFGKVQHRDYAFLRCGYFDVNEYSLVQAGGSGFYTDTLAKLHQFLPLQDYLAFYLAYQNKDMEKPTCEERFIAHGGGKIDGYIYTNALDALDFSYKQGARLFELDLIETSDGKLVAAHDWKYYKTITNYSGSVDDVPLSEAEFLSQRIYGKFTPLHMGRINTWFAQHEDAILITDKINDPQKLAEHFVFADRVIMELFSRDAVEMALKIGITPMLSDNLVFETPNIEKKLVDLPIQYLAISRRNIASHQNLLKRIKNKGIKTYVFHVNFDEGKNEQWVWEQEMDSIYGMYADDLDLLSTCK